MDDPRGVDLAEALASLHRVLDGLRDRKQRGGLQERIEVLALEVLHDEIRRAALERAHVRDASDVFALDPRSRAGLAEKAADGFGARRRMGAPHELQRHPLLELKVSRDDDPAHTALAEQAIDPVLAGEHRSGRERYRVGARRRRRTGHRHWHVPWRGMMPESGTPRPCEVAAAAVTTPGLQVSP